jgi:hypothetical protein
LKLALDICHLHPWMLYTYYEQQGVREDLTGDVLRAEKFVEKINPFASTRDVEEVIGKIQGQT